MTLSEQQEVPTESEIVRRTDMRHNVPFMVVGAGMAALMLIAGVFSLGGREHAAQVAFGPVPIDTSPNHPTLSRNKASDRS